VIFVWRIRKKRHCPARPGNPILTHLWITRINRVMTIILFSKVAKLLKRHAHKVRHDFFSLLSLRKQGS
jgi:hypothetical protein